MNFTVAICCFNSEKRLPEVLECLELQHVERSLEWEVIVVDNNSTDETKNIIHWYQNKWTTTLGLRYCFEFQQGLAFARQRAIEEARSPLVGFLDDDNLPQNNWVQEAYYFAQKYPRAGAYGSQIDALFESIPPTGFEKISYFLAITPKQDQPFCYKFERKMLPPGAGLVVRRQVWLDYVPKKLFLSGRVGQSTLASEDLEALIYLQRGGWEIWHNPVMKIKHRIPAYRLQEKYLKDLVRGIGLARYHIRMLRFSAWQRPIFTPLSMIIDVYRIIRFFLRHYRELKTDLAIQLEMEFLMGTFFSPFYLFKNVWLKSAFNK